VGNALEVKEAIKVLKSEGPKDVEKLCLFLGGIALVLAGKVRNPEDGQKEMEKILSSGAGFEKFRQMIAAQGGDLKYIDNPDLLPQAKYTKEIYAPKGGYLKDIDALQVGRLAVHIGAGRSEKGEAIDPGVGVLLNCKVGERVKKGALLATLFINNEADIAASEKELSHAFLIVDEMVEPLPMIHGIVPPFPS